MKQGLHQLIPFYYKLAIDSSKEVTPIELIDTYLNGFTKFDFDPYVKKLYEINNTNLEVSLFNNFLKECIYPAIDWFNALLDKENG